MRKVRLKQPVLQTAGLWGSRSRRVKPKSLLLGAIVKQSFGRIKPEVGFSGADLSVLQDQLYHQLAAKISQHQRYKAA